ncbi:MAG: 4Fe-4S ferredoxin [Deltaproteobacteria bacterium]|nr:4Fe-4S ferredoxin [Deltaproteobacteria bacterium]
MRELLKTRVAEMLREGRVDGVVGLIESHGEPLPYLFTADDTAALERISTGELQGRLAELIPGVVRYPLGKILTAVARKHPDKRFGVMCRACDERVVFGLFQNLQLDPDKVEILGLPCKEELARACSCPAPAPRSAIVDQPSREAWDRADLERIDAMALDERFAFWVEELGRCIKCYGCRNACPVCFCDVCTLQDDGLVKKGEIPAELPAFQLTRAWHMVGRCVDCGLCQEACPMDIPIRTIYRKVRSIVGELFDYFPGERDGGKSPLEQLGDGSFPIQ